MGRWWPMVGVVALRLLFGVYLSTSFTPDEYYQGVEPAYDMVFGDGSPRTWEWTPAFQIRSHVLIVPYAGVMYVGKLLGLDSSAFVAIAPRVLQGLLSSAADYAVYAFVWLFTDTFVVGWNVDKDMFAAYVAAVHVLSWCGLYCGSRTLANTTEASLVAISLYLLLWSYVYERRIFPMRQSFDVAYFMMVLVSYARPTSLIILGPLVLAHAFTAGVRATLARERSTDSAGEAPPKRGAVQPIRDHNAVILCRHLLAKERLLPALMALALCVGADYIGYAQEWSSVRDAITSFSCVKFFTVNVLQQVAARFGTKDWHWYLLKGIPQVLGMWGPIALLGVAVRRDLGIVKPLPPPLFVLATGGVWLPMVLGICTAHQEFRFLLPAAPFMHIVAGWVLYSADDTRLVVPAKASKAAVNTKTPEAAMLERVRQEKARGAKVQAFPAAAKSSPGSKHKGSNGEVPVSAPVQAPVARPTWWPHKPGRMMLTVLGVLHVVLAAYLGGWHQAGPEQALAFVADHATVYWPGESREVHLLAPCYAFPGQSFVHGGSGIDGGGGRAGEGGGRVVLRSPQCWPVKVQGPKASKAQTQAKDKNDKDGKKERQSLAQAQAQVGLQDESHRFRADPSGFWANKTMTPAAAAAAAAQDTCTDVDPRSCGTGPWSAPALVVTLDGYEPALRDALHNRGYRLVWSAHHAHYRYDYDDAMVHKRVLVYALP